MEQHNNANTRPPQFLGRYALLREAGRGGMSTVYEAQDTQIGRRVAIKVVSVSPHLPAAQRDALVNRLRREARAIASMTHPNIVTIFDVGEDNGVYYLVMEYLDGQTVRQRLETSGPFSPREAADVIAKVADGLDAVHAHGVLTGTSSRRT
jgi:serine/threonine-protein kinase